jgi:hypothetical protein
MAELFTVIGIDLDDADTWMIEIEANSPKEALINAVKQYCKDGGVRAPELDNITRPEFWDVEAHYALNVVEGELRCRTWKDEVP